MPRSKDADVPLGPPWLKPIGMYLRPRLTISGKRVEADSEDAPAHPVVPQRRRIGQRHLGLP
jgi:hypothetical protein